MKCPNCGIYDKENRVVDSRPWKHTIRRRRRCNHCQHTWATYEASEPEFFSDRNANKYLKWSQAEEENLVRMKESGMKNTAIGRALGRHRNSVEHKVRKLLENGHYFLILNDLEENKEVEI